MGALQALLDRSLHWPQWAGFSLLALAAAITLLGRKGQRLLNAVLLGGGAVALSLAGLRGAIHVWVPGVTAVVGGVIFALFGLVAARWATALVIALLLAAGGALAAHQLHLFMLPVAMLLGGVGLFIGMVNHKPISIGLPPIFAAAFVAWGCAISWAPNWRGAKLWQLNDLDWVLGFAGVAAVILLGLSFEREHRRKLRLALRAKELEEAALQETLESRKAAYQRVLDQADDPPKGSSQH